MDVGATTFPASDASFAAYVRQVLGARRWDLQSPEGRALLQALLRHSYPVATVIAREQLVPDGRLALATVVAVYRDGFAVSPGDAPRWMSEVFERYGSEAYGLALAVLRDPAAADAALEDALLSTVRRDWLARDRDAAGFSLLYAVRQRATGMLRHRNQVDPSWDTGEPSTVEVAGDLPGREAGLGPGTARARHALSPDLRVVFDLSYMEGLAPDATGLRLGIDPGQVVDRLDDALKMLVTALANELAGQPDASAGEMPREALPVHAALARWREAELRVARAQTGGPEHNAAAEERDSARANYWAAIERVGHLRATYEAAVARHRAEP